MVHALRLCGNADGYTLLNSSTVRSPPETSCLTGYSGAKRKKGSKMCATVDTLEHLLSPRVTSATKQNHRISLRVLRGLSHVEATLEKIARMWSPCSSRQIRCVLFSYYPARERLLS